MSKSNLPYWVVAGAYMSLVLRPDGSIELMDTRVSTCDKDADLTCMYTKLKVDSSADCIALSKAFLRISTEMNRRKNE